MSSKSHISVVVCGHVDAGKSTTTGRLIFDLGGIDERTMKKLTEEADKLDKGSFKFAFFMDTQKEERERGITIQCTTKEFFTNRYHYTIVDAPGHRDFIKNMIKGSSTADTALLLVPADGGFTTAIKKGDHKAQEVTGQTRQHALILNLLGIKQLIVCVNKMDSGTANYSEERFNEVRDEMRNMLRQTGWTKQLDSIPILPISGWSGDNLTTQSSNMPWWKGVNVKSPDGKDVNVKTLLEALNDFVESPKRKPDASLRIPVSGVYTIKGVGPVIAGRVEQGTVHPGDELVFVPTHSESNECRGKVFSIEMHHTSVPQAIPGDNVGLNIKGLDKERMPSVGDVMVLSKDTALHAAKKITVQVQVMDHPGELVVGYTPTGIVRTCNAPLKMVELKWKMVGKEKVLNPPHLKAGDMAEVVFEPQKPMVVEKFTDCEGLGRVAVMEGPNVVMLGKVVGLE